jgi:hypothetical protein
MNNSTNSILNRPAVGLMPNYPKKQGKMFHIELGQNVSVIVFLIFVLLGGTVQEKGNGGIAFG